MESGRVRGVKPRKEGGKTTGQHMGSKGRAQAAKQPLSECRENSSAV